MRIIRISIFHYSCLQNQLENFFYLNNLKTNLIFLQTWLYPIEHGAFTILRLEHILERKKERKKVYLSSSRNKHGYKDNNRHISVHSHVAFDAVR